MTKEEIIQKQAVEYVNTIENEFQGKLTFGERVADNVSAFVGSWKFIWWTSGFLVIWIVFNSLQLFGAIRIDPFPYVLLNLMLSFVAAFQSPLILLSGSRQSQRDRYYADIDFKQNFVAQKEIEEVHIHVEEIIEANNEIKEMYAEMQDMYPMIKEIHKFITDNGWDKK